MLLDSVDLTKEDEDARALANAVRGLDFEYRQFRRRIADAAGISLTEFEVLSGLSWSDEAMTPKALAELIHVTTSAMTTMLDRLAGVELVCRQPHPSDRRSLHITLTEHGRTVVARIYRSYVHAFGEIVRETSAPDLTALIATLGRLTSAVARADASLDLEALASS